MFNTHSGKRRRSQLDFLVSEKASVVEDDSELYAYMVKFQELSIKALQKLNENGLTSQSSVDKILEILVTEQNENSGHPQLSIEFQKKIETFKILPEELKLVMDSSGFSRNFALRAFMLCEEIKRLRNLGLEHGEVVHKFVQKLETLVTSSAEEDSTQQPVVNSSEFSEKIPTANESLQLVNMIVNGEKKTERDTKRRKYDLTDHFLTAFEEVAEVDQSDSEPEQEIKTDHLNRQEYEAILSEDPDFSKISLSPEITTLPPLSQLPPPPPPSQLSFTHSFHQRLGLPSHPPPSSLTRSNPSLLPSLSTLGLERQQSTVVGSSFLQHLQELQQRAHNRQPRQPQHTNHTNDRLSLNPMRLGVENPSSWDVLFNPNSPSSSLTRGNPHRLTRTRPFAAADIRPPSVPSWRHIGTHPELPDDDDEERDEEDENEGDERRENPMDLNMFSTLFDDYFSDYSDTSPLNSDVEGMLDERLLQRVNRLRKKKKEEKQNANIPSLFGNVNSTTTPQLARSYSPPTEPERSPVVRDIREERIYQKIDTVKCWTAKDQKEAEPVLAPKTTTVPKPAKMFPLQLRRPQTPSPPASTNKTNSHNTKPPAQPNNLCHLESRVESSSTRPHLPSLPPFSSLSSPSTLPSTMPPPLSSSSLSSSSSLPSAHHTTQSPGLKSISAENTEATWSYIPASALASSATMDFRKLSGIELPKPSNSAPRHSSPPPATHGNHEPITFKPSSSTYSCPSSLSLWSNRHPMSSMISSESNQYSCTTTTTTTTSTALFTSASSEKKGGREKRPSSKVREDRKEEEKEHKQDQDRERKRDREEYDDKGGVSVNANVGVEVTEPKVTTPRGKKKRAAHDHQHDEDHKKRSKYDKLRI